MSSPESVSFLSLLRIFSRFPIALPMKPKHINLAFNASHDLVPIKVCSIIFISLLAALLWSIPSWSSISPSILPLPMLLPPLGMLFLAYPSVEYLLVLQGPA